MYCLSVFLCSSSNENRLFLLLVYLTILHPPAFLESRHLIHGVNYLTFQELVRGTGLSPRTLRKILPQLRELGLIEVLIDSTTYRRYLYKLNFRNLPCESTSLERGVYLIDVGVGVLRYMNLKAIQIIRHSDVIMYTDAIPSKILETKYHFPVCVNSVSE